MDRPARQVGAEHITQARQSRLDLIQQHPVLARRPRRATVGQTSPHGRSHRVLALDFEARRRLVQARQNRARRRLISL